MRRDNIPTAGRRRCEDAAADSIARQQTITDAASVDALHLRRAGDGVRAGGALLTYFGATLPRTAAVAGGEGAPTEVDLDDEARSADVLVRIGASLAAAMARGAVADEHTALAKRAAFQGPGGRP